MNVDTDFSGLINRLRSGDEKAAHEILSQYEDTIRRFVRVRLTDPALKRQMDSVDICQSVMADFFVRMAFGQFEIQSPQQLVNLLATMARNRLINHSKKQHAQRRDVHRLNAADVAELQPPAKIETPSEAVAGKELLEEFQQRLTPEERELATRRSRGEEWADIAAAMGGKPDALRVRLSRAIERVAAELGLDDSHYE
jgi:RNA polymerase sigma factor (sigma-70 family)